MIGVAAVIALFVAGAPMWLIWVAIGVGAIFYWRYRWTHGVREEVAAAKQSGLTRAREREQRRLERRSESD